MTDTNLPQVVNNEENLIENIKEIEETIKTLKETMMALEKSRAEHKDKLFEIYRNKQKLFYTINYIKNNIRYDYDNTCGLFSSYEKVKEYIPEDGKGISRNDKCYHYTIGIIEAKNVELNNFSKLDKPPKLPHNEEPLNLSR